MEYFEFSRGFKKNLISDNILSVKDNLFEKENSIANKKKLLVQLASLRRLKLTGQSRNMFRSRTQNSGNGPFLLFRKAVCLIQSKLLDENQVFISTGLGGKVRNCDILLYC
jgi:hypothetical protein